VGERVDEHCIDVVLRQARTQNGYLAKPVTDEELRAVYDLMKLGPTSANCSPARFIFVRTPQGKARLLPALSAGNQEKTKQAPVTVIMGYDTKFYELLPTKLFTHRPEMKDPYEKNPVLAETVAFRNSTLQGAYFMLAARMLGLDVGGMSGSTTPRSTPSSSRTAA
jgi:3-hydroxypropanoate dehydrogenase